jgi:hypothetical protein
LVSADPLWIGDLIRIGELNAAMLRSHLMGRRETRQIYSLHAPAGKITASSDAKKSGSALRSVKAAAHLVTRKAASRHE